MAKKVVAVVTCKCEAYPFPHRLGGGRCQADKMCPHGVLLPEHPDYDRAIDRCYICSGDMFADFKYDSRI